VRPVLHHLVDFVEGLVYIIVSCILWREELVSAVVLGLSGQEVRAGMVRLSIGIVIMAIDDSGS